MRIITYTNINRFNDVEFITEDDRNHPYPIFIKFYIKIMNRLDISKIFLNEYERFDILDEIIPYNVYNHYIISIRNEHFKKYKGGLNIRSTYVKDFSKYPVPDFLETMPAQLALYANTNLIIFEGFKNLTDEQFARLKRVPALNNIDVLKVI